MAALLGDKQPGGLALHGRGDEDRTGPCGALDPRGDIRRIAEHFTRCVDYPLPGIKADAGGKFRGASAGVSGVDLNKRALDRERRAHGTFGVVLLRVRIPKQRHQPVAELFQHMAAEPGHRRRSLVEIGVDECAPILGVQLCGETCRAYEIAEHHGDRAALGRDFGTLGRHRLRSGRSRNV